MFNTKLASEITIHNYQEFIKQLTFTDYCNLISISKGNRKTGAIRSLSLPPFITCDPGLHCYKDCYARKVERYSPDAKKAYKRNLDLYQANKKLYWDAIQYLTKIDSFFRYSVAGDIADRDYLQGIHDTAIENKNCRYLVFTKKYKLVNNFYSENIKPDNLIILFSVDFDQVEPDNPHKFPLIHVVESLENIPDNWSVCGGNCFDCICRNTGCWTLEPGARLAILKH